MEFITDKPQFTEDILIVPIQSDLYSHWVNNQMSFFYIYAIESRKEYILNFNHNDSICSTYSNEVLTDKRQFVYNKHDLTGIEAKCLIWLQSNEIKRHQFNTKVKFFHNKLRDTKNINDIVPIMLLIEYCQDIKDEFILNYNKFTQWEALRQYSELQSNLSIIEQNGLFTSSGFEHSEYHLYTLTGRPSNHFNNINYAALNKDDGSRDRFISRFGANGFLIEFDLRAFHIYLLSNLVKYTWPEPDIYAYFQTLYGNNVSSKEETFRQIYGGIDQKYSHIEFFQMIDKLTVYLYTEYELGQLKTFLFDRNFNISNLNKLKVFNYLLQSYETEFNASLISKLNDYLYSRHGKLILYTYDSFLIDFCKDDGRECLIGLKNIFGNIPFRIKKGQNYGEMC